MKAKALGRDEVMLLLDLISNHKIITSKSTNATNNRLKEVAWQTISQEFSSQVEETRRPEQLRLKWENLKKSSRKRSAAIRENNLNLNVKKYIPPDMALERVSSILTAACNDLPIECNGNEVAQINVENVTQALLPQISESIGVENVVVIKSDDTEDSSCYGGVGIDDGGTQINEPIETPETNQFDTPNNSLNKRRKLTEEVLKAQKEKLLAQKEKNLALAAYFRAKAENIELQNLKLKQRIEQFNKKKNMCLLYFCF